MATLKKNKKRPWEVSRHKKEARTASAVRETFYDSATWRKLRDRVKQRDQFLCQQCKKEGTIKEVGLKPKDYAVDHIIPVNEGGERYSISNLQLLCSRCHAGKSARERKRGGGSDPYSFSKD